MSICAGQSDGGQHGVAAVRAIEAIQHTHRALVVHHFVVHGNIGNAEVGELYTLDGIFCQLVHDGIIVQAGADV